MSSIIIANCVSIVELLLSFKRHSEINRNKVIIIDSITYTTSIITYILTSAYSGILVNAYGIIRLTYMVLAHRKEKKIKISKLEGIILNIPIIFIAVKGFQREGIIAILYNAMQILRGCEYCFKTDNSRVKANVLIEIVYAIYNGLNMSIVKSVKNTINVIINIVNIIRIKKNGEDKYYKR